MNIIVSGGTSAGWKRPRPKAQDWRCPHCGTRLKHFWTACPNDNARRPEPSQTQEA